MRFLKISYADLVSMPEGYDDMAVEVSRREKAERESAARRHRR